MSGTRKGIIDAAWALAGLEGRRLTPGLRQSQSELDFRFTDAGATAVETIRYYEREGLVPAPARTASNYRSYGAEHLARLQFIRHCRGLDLSLEEIRVLLRLKDAPQENCSDVNAVLDAHIGHVTHRIRELRALEKELKCLRAQCGEAREAGVCGILEGLSRASDPPQKPGGPSPLKGVHRRT
jgi:Cd(II)/Pb(II)-responsive transcriptional regulator